MKTDIFAVLCIVIPVVVVIFGTATGEPIPLRCTLPFLAGNGMQREPVSFYSGTTNSCHVEFYSGKGGNGNRFYDMKECVRICHAKEMLPRVYPEYCYLDPEYGDCQKQITLFYYNYNTKQCENFVYSGCGGSKNRFYRKSECQFHCVRSDK